jgi:hypothetical protein
MRMFELFVLATLTLLGACAISGQDAAAGR